MPPAEFIGAWTLRAMEVRRSDGEVSFPLGARPRGLLIYTEGGRMSAQLGSDARARFSSEDRLGGTDAELRQAFGGYIAYAGRFEVDPVRRVVSHQVELSLFPNWVGTRQEREFELEGRTLVLRSRPMQLGGFEQRAVLVWDRVEGTEA